MLAITDLLLKLSTSCFANANWSFSHGPRPDSCRKKGSRRTHKTPIFCAWWWDLLSWSSKASFLTLYFFARAASGKIYGGVQININPFCGPIAKCNYRQNRVSRTFYSWIFVRKDLENTNWITRYIFFLVGNFFLWHIKAFQCLLSADRWLSSKWQNIATVEWHIVIPINDTFDKKSQCSQMWLPISWITKERYCSWHHWK